MFVDPPDDVVNRMQERAERLVGGMALGRRGS
jgi:hypothetical protein